jgi:hypothetical protein
MAGSCHKILNIPKMKKSICTILPLLLSSVLPANLYAQSFSILLGRPTNESVTMNIIPDQDGEISIEYGTATGVYGTETGAIPCTAGDPVETLIGGLSSNERYFYRLRFRASGGDPWIPGEEYSFHTQRIRGTSFTFTIIADSHLGQYGGNTPDQMTLYEQTLLNVSGDNPDFHLDLGDAFPMDPQPLGTGMTDAEVKAAYLTQRPFLDLISHSVPVYLIIGNHENEEGWNFDDVFTPPDGNLALQGIKYRKLYYPNPVPNAFYSGNTDISNTDIEGDHLREDYYAWEWGDVLFVVIEPFHYSMTWPSEGQAYGGEGMDGEAQGDRWDWTLGSQQYEWLKSTLENSDAPFKFVFTHHVTGGVIPYGRGGTAAAPYFEWGGYNWDGTWGFDTERPGWEMPIHQLLVANGVNAFFHGHDHLFAVDELDGIVYQECPKPDDDSYSLGFYNENPSLYPTGTILPCSGHIRVTVSAGEAVVDYIRAYLPGEGTNGEIAYSYIIEPEEVSEPDLLGDVNGDEMVNSTDALVVLSCDAGIDVSQFCPMNCGDINEDGLVNSTDALIILSYDAGMSIPFPVGEPGCPSIISPCPGCTP